jgi:hypothetical protein
MLISIDKSRMYVKGYETTRVNAGPYYVINNVKNNITAAEVQAMKAYRVERCCGSHII